MDLNLSNRGLFSFDAVQARRSLVPSVSSDSAQQQQHARAAVASATPALPVIQQLNLSYNSLHLFTGGETLRGLTVLDLSHNELAQLHTRSLPASLVRLNVSHNRLAHLAQLADCTPRLQVLDVGHNQMSSSGLRGLPITLTQLHAEANLLDSLSPFTPLLHLVRLNVAMNQLESSDALTSLHSLHSLRVLDVRGNPLCEEEDEETNRSADSSTETVGKMNHRRLAALMGNILPRLAHLNGVSLSQAPENRLLKHGQKAREGQLENSNSANRSNSLNGSRVRSSAGVNREQPSYASSSRGSIPVRPALEIRLMQAKVSELRRLLLAAQDAEGKARQERSLLMENVKSTAVVIDQQGAELEGLQEEIARLRDEALQLRAPMAAAEESFEQVHASLLAAKAKESAARLKQ